MDDAPMMDVQIESVLSCDRNFGLLWIWEMVMQSERNAENGTCWCSERRIFRDAVFVCCCVCRGHSARIGERVWTFVKLV